MSEINESSFERVTFGTGRLPAWQRWEGISDPLDENSRSLNLVENTPVARSMRSNKDTLSHSWKKRTRHRSKFAINEHRAHGDVEVNRTANRYDCDAHFREDTKMHPEEDLGANAGSFRRESVMSSGSDQESTLSAGARKVCDLSVCKGAGSPENGAGNPTEKVLTANNNNSPASSDDTMASISKANAPPSSPTGNTTPRYRRTGSNLLQHSSSVDDCERKAMLIISKDDRDRQQILVCNGHVDTVIFGPCTVNENKPQEEQSEELKYNVHKISENCTQVKELCTLLVQLTSQLAIKLGTLENK